MAPKLEGKQAIVAELRVAVDAALSAVAADYRGLTVAELTAMRAQAREQGVSLQVVRNTLARRAVAGTRHEPLQEAFAGPTLIAFSRGDPGAAARLLRDCVAEYGALEVKALSVGDGVLDAAELGRVAALPTLDEARAQLMSVMLAPLGKLARTLAEVPGKLVRTLAAVGEAKDAN